MQDDTEVTLKRDPYEPYHEELLAHVQDDTEVTLKRDPYKPYHEELLAHVQLYSAASLAQLPQTHLFFVGPVVRAENYKVKANVRDGQPMASECKTSIREAIRQFRDSNPGHQIQSLG